MVKFKSRYLLVETLFNDDSHKKIDTTKMSQIIKKQVEDLFGEVGLGKINKNLQVKYYNNYTKLMIIRLSKDHVNLAWTALALINNLEGDKCRMHIIGNSGTIKKCETKAQLFLEKWLINYEKSNCLK
jgi:RNase P/RNase MRP subunit POP5